MNKLSNANMRTMLLTFLLALAFISALVLLTGRIRMESESRTVELVMDYNDLTTLGKNEFIPERELLQKMKNAGVVSIAFTEMNLAQLQDQGRLQWMTGSNLGTLLRMTGTETTNMPPLYPDRIYVFEYAPELGELIRKNLTLLRGEQMVREIRIQTGKNKIVPMLEISGNPQELPYTSMGFDPLQLKKARDNGFHIVLRPDNHFRLNEEGIRDYLHSLSAIPKVTTLIFSGSNEVLGFPRNLEATVDSFRHHNFAFGDIEVPNVQARQKGAQYITLKVPERTVRVMSFTSQHLAKLSPEDVVDKFRLGVRERNLRLLYLRPFTAGFNGKTTIETNIEYISSLRKELTGFGFITGPASRFPNTNPHPALVLLISLGAGAVLMLLYDLFREDPKNRILLAVLIASVLFPAGLIALGKLAIVQKITGLILGLVFPVYAFASRFGELRDLEEQRGFFRIFGFALKNFLIITLITITGGLMIAGLFSSTTFMLTADQFRGIKLIISAPLLITLALYYLKGKKDGLNLGEFARQPLYIWQLVFLGGVGLVGLIYLLRSGNAGDAVSSSHEITLRVFLEKFLWVRPRFKAFMVGHPAMILTWGLAAMGIFSGLGIPILAASIGQADIIDTFAHVHTPVFISLVRVLLGALIGIGFGSLFLAVFQVIKLRFMPRTEEITENPPEAEELSPTATT